MPLGPPSIVKQVIESRQAHVGVVPDGLGAGWGAVGLGLLGVVAGMQWIASRRPAANSA